MGFGLPAAIAASLHDPDRISVAVCGDGGFAMSMMEIETAVREGAHPVVIVFDNQLYGTTALDQVHRGGPTRTSELGPIDMAAVARAHGALGFSVAREEEFEPALRDAISARHVSVIHIALDRAWRSVDDNPVLIPT
jgi:acetolactate synthase-1/2/3 large subunit